MTPTLLSAKLDLKAIHAGGDPCGPCLKVASAPDETDDGPSGVRLVLPEGALVGLKLVLVGEPGMALTNVTVELQGAKATIDKVSIPGKFTPSSSTGVIPVFPRTGANAALPLEVQSFVLRGTVIFDGSTKPVLMDSSMSPVDAAVLRVG